MDDPPAARGAGRTSARGADVAVGDVVRLRKAHPCGSDAWTILRLGADIGLRCNGCGRRVMLPRAELARRLRGAAGSARPSPDRSD